MGWISVGILGASGFAGGELLRILLGHPVVTVRFLSSEARAGSAVSDVLPGLRNHPQSRRLRFERLEQMPDVDVAFSCLPHGVLPRHLQLVASRAPLVILLSGDYRLRDQALVAKHYPASLDHPWPDQLTYAVPELTASMPASGVLSIPGCTAAASLYAFYPLWINDLVQPSLIVDAKTGSSGAGRVTSESPSDRLNNFRPHRLHGHRHEPEVVQALRDARAGDLRLVLATHSLDLPRGVFVTGYAQLREGVEAMDVRRAYVQAYLRAPFVSVILPGRSRAPWPTLKSVLGSNVVEVGVSVQATSCVAVASLDNLIKGAAGQAVQVMNRALGLPEQEGLPLTGTWP